MSNAGEKYLVVARLLKVTFSHVLKGLIAQDSSLDFLGRQKPLLVSLH